MIQDIGRKKLNNQYVLKNAKEEDVVLLFVGNSKAEERVLLSNREDCLDFPLVKDVKKACSEFQLQYLFSITEEETISGEKACGEAKGEEKEVERNYFLYQGPPLEELPGFSYEPIRFMRSCAPMEEVLAGMTGYHLYQWYRDNRYCGRCGEKLIHSDKMRMLSCSCGNMVFPRINPAVIIGVTKGDKILTSRYAGRAYKGRALLAGFCEIGESAEETVRREVMEEVGLKVKNIRYYASQPWGLEMDLLLGYFCEVDGEEQITLDEDELSSAGFESRTELPEENNLISLTATMIEAFRKGETEPCLLKKQNNT